MTVVSREDITKQSRKSRLSKGKQRTGGRNSTGRDLSRASAAADTSRAYRIIDFKRDKTGVPAKVAAIEYDPNRSARIALLHYADGEKRYILAPGGSGSRPEGDRRDRKRTSWSGNALPLKNIPAGTVVHNIELRPGKGAQMARSAGAQAQLVSREGGMALLKLPSGEIRRVSDRLHGDHRPGRQCRARERSRWARPAASAGWASMPHNRGVTMNPVDHPHGGGEGKTSGGRHPVTPWGQPTRGFKTRNNKRTDKLIVSAGRRRSGRGS